METQYSNSLQINKLSKSQYDREAQDGALDSTALYLTPTEDLVIKLNGGTTEGTNKFTYNGSTAKSVNITPSSIGAATTSHTHGNITSDGKLGTASRVVVTDSDKKITVASAITTTELGYLDGVTSAIQTQLNGKLGLEGGIMTGVGQIVSNHTGARWIDARDTALIRHDTFLNSSSYSPILSCKISDGEISNGIIHPEDRMVWTYTADSNYPNTNNHTVLMSLAPNQYGGIITGLYTVTAQGFTATSDKRLKENIESYSCDRSILDLDVKKFDFIKGAKNQIGCLAQDLQEICPEIVSEDKEGYLSIQESKIVYLLLEEVKKLKAEVKSLQSK